MAKGKKRIRLAFYITGGVIVLLLLGILIYVAIFRSKMGMNPAGTVGNTAGNLNNSGLFCEYNDTVYFSNSTDNGALYAMNPDESDMRKLYSMSVRNILAGGNYLYYFQLSLPKPSGLGGVGDNHSLNRCDLKGNKTVSLTKDVVTAGQLVDNYLYLLVAGKEHPEFYKLKIDKSDRVDLADYAINPACAKDSMIYYNGTQGDHALYALNTANDAPTKIWDGDLWYPVLYGNYIYYMDVSAHYSLCRYSMSAQTVEVLTNDRVDCFNVGGGYVYYQTSDAVSPQLKCMRDDGSNPFVVADGTYTNINMTSQYVYFQKFGVDGSLFHARLGSDQYSTFGN